MSNSTQSLRSKLDSWKKDNPLVVWRDSEGLSRYDVAAILAVTYNAVAKWEAGVTNPSSDNMSVISRVTGGKVDSTSWEKWRSASPFA